MSAVHGLIGAFDFYRNGGLAFFADGDLFMVALDGLAVVGGLVGCLCCGENGERDRGGLHSA